MSQMDAMIFGTDNDRPQYIGTSVWVKVAGHFGPRLSEWAGSVEMLLLGAVFLTQVNAFVAPEFAYFKAVFGTQTLPGVVLFLFGFLGLVGLTINGMRKEITPWIRYSRASVGFLLFTGMSTCFALSGVISFWIAWLPVAAVVELVNMFRTSKDAGEYHGSP